MKLIIIIALALFMTFARADQNSRYIRSDYKRPGGEFLLPQVDSPYKAASLHEDPPHLQQLRVARRSEEILYRDITVPENTKRIRRSPQLRIPKIGADIGVGTDGVRGEVGLGGLGGKVDLKLPNVGAAGVGLNVSGRVPKVIADAGKIGTNLEADVSKAEAAITGLGKIGDDFLAKNRDLNPDASLGVADTNAGVRVNAGLGNASGTVELNIPKPEINLNLGSAGSGSTTTTKPTTTTTKPTTTTTKPTTTTTKPTTTTTTTGTSAAATESAATTTEPITTTTEDSITTTTTSTTPSTTTESAEDYDNEIIEREVQPVAQPLTVVEYNIIDGELQLPENYNILEPPESVGSFVFVKILGVHEIDEVREKLSFDMDLTVEWTDAKILAASMASKNSSSNTDSKDTSIRRRRYAEGSMNSDLETLSPDFLKKIWRPDIYMEDLVKIEYPTISGRPVVSLKLNKRTGFFSYTVRMTVDVNCPMSFVYYPADTQTCQLRLASYSHSNDELKIDWLEVDKDLYGVHIDDPSHNQFEVKARGIEKLVLSPVLNNPDHASYDVLQFQVTGRRKLSYHITQTYLPSAFHIFVTWLVFLIPYSLYDSRIGTTMTTLLTMTALFSSVRETAPAVSYMKAIDLWMLVCVFFVFLNLVELTLMTWLRTAIEEFNKRAEEEDRRRIQHEKDPDVYMYRGSHGKPMRDPEERDHITLRTIKKFEKLENIYKFFEKYSFRLFIFLFVLFNIIYWVWLIVASKYCKWSDDSDVEA